MELWQLFILAASESVQWGVYALGAITILYVVFRPALKKKKKDPLADPAPRFGLAQQRSVERQMQNLLVEMSDMARQITAQIDTRAARLEALMSEADGKIAELRRLAEGAVHREPSAIAGSGRPGGDASAPRYVAINTPPVKLHIPMSKDDRYEEVYNLADDGKSPQEIAGRLGRPRGEVELILALRVKA